MSATLQLEVPAYSVQISRAAGKDAGAIATEVAGVAKDLHSAETLSRNKREALKRVCAAVDDFQWHDVEDLATASSSVRFAQAFIHLLPEEVPTPDVDLAVDGEVTFEWIAARGKRLLLSFSRLGDLNYAAVYPNGVSKGREYFAGNIPQAISLALGRVLG